MSHTGPLRFDSTTLESNPSNISRREDLVSGGISPSRFWAAGNHVDALSHYRGAQAMAGRGHRRPGGPRVCGGIVRFVLIEGNCFYPE